MTYLVAVAGFTGAGKTTAVEYLKPLCGGEVVYLGAAVLEYMHDNGIPTTAENELKVRRELREQNPAAFAMLKADTMVRFLGDGIPVLVDAIFTQSEFDLLKARAARFSAHLISISTPFSTRCERLKTRPNRPLTELEVAKRDQYETERLGIDQVLAAATHDISNESSRQEFHDRLTELLKALSG